MGLVRDSYNLDGVFVAGECNAYQINATNDQYAQNFIVTGGYTAASIKLGLSRSNSPGTFTAALYAVDGATGKPTGAALASGTSNGDTLSSGLTVTWREIVFDASASLSAATEYSIVLSCATADASNALNWFYDYDADPAQEELWESTDGGSSWSQKSSDYGNWYALYDDFAPPAAGPTKRRLVGAANGAFYYEDV